MRHQESPRNGMPVAGQFIHSSASPRTTTCSATTSDADPPTISIRRRPHSGDGAAVPPPSILVRSLATSHQARQVLHDKDTESNFAGFAGLPRRSMSSPLPALNYARGMFPPGASSDSSKTGGSVCCDKGSGWCCSKTHATSSDGIDKSLSPHAEDNSVTDPGQFALNLSRTYRKGDTPRTEHAFSKVGWTLLLSPVQASPVDSLEGSSDDARRRSVAAAIAAAAASAIPAAASAAVPAAATSAVAAAASAAVPAAVAARVASEAAGAPDTYGDSIPGVAGAAAGEFAEAAAVAETSADTEAMAAAPATSSSPQSLSSSITSAAPATGATAASVQTASRLAAAASPALPGGEAHVDAVRLHSTLTVNTAEAAILGAEKHEANGHKKSPILDSTGCSSGLQSRSQSLSILADRRPAANRLQQAEGPRSPHEIDLKQLFLGKQFASGAFGKVVLGQYNGLDVAVKFLCMTEESAVEGGEQPPPALKQFHQETSLLAQLDHPNIVKFVGAVQQPPFMLVVTEYLGGGTLRAILNEHRAAKTSMELGAALSAALDLAQGMAFLHSQGIVHRDLKPDNIIFSLNGTLKVVDFGIARLEGKATDMTAEMGTYRWMAPEVIMHKPYTRKVDVYSFAIILWEMLSGELPFHDMSSVQCAFAVADKGLRPPMPKGLPPQLVALIQNSWHDNPRKRPDFPDVVRTLKGLCADVVGSEAVVEQRGIGRSSLRKGNFLSLLRHHVKRFGRSESASSSPAVTHSARW